jgi:hypothetical protein
VPVCPDPHLQSQVVSAIRFPVFKDGQNYSIYSPRMTRLPLLRRFIDEYLAPEVRRFPKALFVPNGPAVAEALLVAGVDESRCLCGFSHASNGPGAKDREEVYQRSGNKWPGRSRPGNNAKPAERTSEVRPRWLLDLPHFSQPNPFPSEQPPASRSAWPLSRCP